MVECFKNSLPKSFYIASDHAGYELKEFIIQQLSAEFGIKDLGVGSEEPVDYPDYANLLCQKIDNNYFGVLICGSGIGMSIAANRYSKIRAALCHSLEYVELAREHNNANVLVLGARFLQNGQAVEMVKLFYNTKFRGGKHLRRIEKLSGI